MQAGLTPSCQRGGLPQRKKKEPSVRPPPWPPPGNPGRLSPSLGKSCCQQRTLQGTLYSCLTPGRATPQGCWPALESGTGRSPSTPRRSHLCSTWMMKTYGPLTCDAQCFGMQERRGCDSSSLPWWRTEANGTCSGGPIHLALLLLLSAVYLTGDSYQVRPTYAITSRETSFPQDP